MSRVLDIESDALIVDLLENTTCLPWIKLTVREDDVGCLEEVALWDTATEVVKSPVVLWLLAVHGLALGSVFCFVPAGRREHGSCGVGSERHGHLIAVLHVPAIVIESTALRDRDVEASELSSVIIESGTCGFDSIKGLIG